MNLISIQVINDCKIACRELEEAETKKNIKIIRIRRLTCLTLLRAVWHIIENVDKKNNPDLAKHFKKKNFIQKERNWILKEYENLIKEEESKQVESFKIAINDEWDRLDIGDGNPLVWKGDEEVTRYFKKKDGFWKEKLLHEVVSSAIQRREEYLKELLSN